MNEVTAEWVVKAESDFDQANLAMYAAEVPIRDGVCYHCQQCTDEMAEAALTSAQKVRAFIRTKLNLT